ncbi:Os01g0809800 [Oryza sativa Japonica Group]|nr:Os01g0809800 [Oryza sativa Japonica Group]
MGRDCRLAAAVVLWESAECHMRDFDPDDEQTARAIESDLKRSVRMLVLENQPQLAASACEELARMYVARRRGSGTSEPRGTASSSAGPGLYRKPSPPPSEEQ